MKALFWGPPFLLIFSELMMLRKGFLTIAFDAPYHGERAVPHAGLKLDPKTAD